jgi:hypothetical protein
MEKIVMKKFELTTDRIEENGTILYRIKALIDFGDVKAGDLGGYVEKEENLSQYGSAWVSDNAFVLGNALVCDNALVCGDTLVCGNAQVYGNAQVSGNAQVCGNTWVCDNAHIYGNALVCSNADYIYLKGFGSHNRNTTMFRTKGGNIAVSCGCFSGTLQEFESKVKETHGNNKFAREYLALVEAAKIHFEV